jgi:iron complex transport system permease protein
VLVALAVGLLLAGVLAVTVGTAHIGPGDALRVIGGKLIPGVRAVERHPLADTIILDFRLPRAVLAVLAGMALAGSGAVMQGVLHNPLVSPFTLGLSSGAAFGAALAIVLGKGVLGISSPWAARYMVVGNAFLFGVLTMVLVGGIARLKAAGPETLVLAGVAFGYLFSAGLAALKYISESQALKELVLWLMGGLWGAGWEGNLILLPVVIGCLTVLTGLGWELNALLAGEEVAVSLGVRVRRLRLLCLALATLMASAVTAFTGVIGFVGLICPHMCRLVIGSDHRFLVPGAALAGGLLLLLADVVARTILPPQEIPVGVVMAFLGGPFFLYLLLRRWHAA